MSEFIRDEVERERRKDIAAQLSNMASDQQERLARHRAEMEKLPYINLTVFPIDPDILENVPLGIAKKEEAVLFYRQGRDVRVAMVDPANSRRGQVMEIARKQFNVEPQIHVVSPRSLATALSRYRREQKEAEIPDGELRVNTEKMGGFEDDLQNWKELGQHVASLPPTEILSTLVAGAVKIGASDLHLEATEQNVRLRYRIDGVLQDITEVPRSAWSLVLSRVKVLARLKLNVRDVPQDGSFVLKVGEKTFDIRVSVLPGGNGENIVMRILDREARAAKITDLGMKQRDYDIIMRQLKLTNGMVLVTGPTGSGKTTSLASFLQEVNNEQIKIITLENPIEYRLKGVEQTQIDEGAGYTFAKGLRAILRQDPDVIMVGEIRDQETAEVAIHAALTGHLVFSTLHTNDAPGAIPRLVDMGAKPFVLAPAINIIIAQRLVRRICKECQEEYVADAGIKDRIRDAMQGVAVNVFDPKALDQEVKLVRAKGCSVCNGTGYQGRVGAFEVMPIEGRVEELILQGADSSQLREAAFQGGMTTIAQDGYLKVLSQITTLEEVERVTEE